LYSCPPDIKSLAYTSLVRPKLEFAAAVWDPHTSKNTLLLDAVQRRGARFVKNNYKSSTSVTQLLSDLGWPPLSTRRRNARLSLFYKSYHNNGPISLASLQRPTRNTRSSCDGFSFIVPQTSCDAYKFSFLPRTVVDWNSCPLSVRQSPSFDTFKSSLLKSCPSY
jgi:hypothetical protein